MRKLPSRKLLGAIIAGVLLLPETAFTLGLGEIEVNSALNQKLKADIELLSATPEDTETLIIKLASRKEFARAGLDRPYQLNDLRFKSEVIDDVPYIKISSSSPIREPFLNFLVEIDWPNGHLIREYTVLLDPPVFMTQPASATPAQAKQNDNTFRPDSAGNTSANTNNVVPVVAPGMTMSARPGSAAIAPTPQSAQPGTTQTSPVFVPAPVVQQQTTINQSPGNYRIKTGDTAWSLAEAMRPDQSITVEQMMLAMLRANPESFIDENVNGLKRGYILRVPDYDQIVAVNQSDARALVREQAALWRQYQQTNAAGQPVSAMPTDVGSAVNGSAATAGQGGEDDAYLEIVSAGSGASTASAKDPTQMSSNELRAELALARERVETERVEKEALQERIDSLEQNLGKMKGMLSIEDDELSDVQALGQSSQDESSEAGVETLEVDEAEMEAAASETDELLAEPSFEEAVEAEAASDMVEGELLEDESAEAEDAIFLDETSADAEILEDGAAEDSSEDVIADDAIEEDIAAQQMPIAAPPAEVDPLTKLLSDPILMAAAGGGLLFILAVIALIIKRRKAAAETTTFDQSDDDLESLADEISSESTENEGETESLAADANEDSAAPQDETEDGSVSEEDAELPTEKDGPRDDVIAEADVYLAYGIFHQAEDLLKQAIIDSPERDDYREKLAETYYASKNADAFVDVATDIKKCAGDKMTPSWKKVMTMGQDLCADNSLFQGSMVGGLDVDSLSPEAPEMDFDLGLDLDDASDASPDPDLNLGDAPDDTPLELPEMDTTDSAEGEKTDDAKTLDTTADELEFDLSDADASEETVAEDDEFSLDIDASELDIDTNDEAEDEEVAIDLTDEIQELGETDLDFGLDEGESAADAPDDEEEIEMDLTNDADALDLDLDEGGDITEEIVAEIASEADDDLADEEAFDLSSLDDVDEVSTKLDLARAYLDMGDNEGTRGILEEVIAEGNDEQKKEASELMEKLN